MKRFRYIICTALCSFVYLYFVSPQSIAYAEASLGESIDCTEVSIDYLEDLNLTREERLRLMDKAFFQSLNKFELCQEARKMAAAADGGSDSGGGSGSDGASGNSGSGNSGNTGAEAGGKSAGESVASSTMSGTETPQKYPSAEGVEAEGSDALQSSQDIAEGGSKSGGNMKRSHGKLPEDIPPAKNDDALAAQIRYAAENEPDPVKSKQLWNEYRKYKGLTTK